MLSFVKKTERRYEREEEGGRRGGKKRGHMDFLRILKDS
jgi:hypothetical protein